MDDKAKKRAMYEKGLIGSSAINQLRNNIKQMIGTLVSGLQPKDLAVIREKRTLAIADADADWVLQILMVDIAPGMVHEQLQVWLEFAGGHGCVFTASIFPNGLANFKHEALSYDVVSFVDAAMPTLVSGMVERFQDVRRDNEVYVAIAEYVESKRLA